jgi:hypothetical protein
MCADANAPAQDEQKENTGSAATDGTTLSAAAPLCHTIYRTINVCVDHANRNIETHSLNRNPRPPAGPCPADVQPGPVAG